MAAATLLRSINLNSDLWLDEVGTLVAFLRLPMHEIVRTYVSMNQHLLYSILGRISILCFGESAWAVRLPAVLFGIGGIPAMYYMARPITTEREALLGSALLTFSYHHIWFSQDARGYSAMVFWSLLGTGFLFRAMVRSNWAYWTGFILAMTLGVVSLQNTLFVVIAQLLCFLILNRRQWRPMLASVIAIAGLSTLCHILMLGQMIHFMRTVDRTGLGWTSIAGFIPVVTSGLAAGFGLVGLFLALLLGIAGWYGYWKQTRLAAGMLVLPVMLNIAMLIALHIGAYPRSFLYGLPFALLIAVRGASRWSEFLGFGTNVALALCLALAAISSLPLIQYYRFPKQNYTGALAYVTAHKESGDTVMAAGLAGVCYQRYYSPGITVPKSVSEIGTLRKPGGKAWVIYSFPREFELRSPEMFHFIRTQLDSMAIFHGTLAGGDMYVARTRM